MHAMQFAASMLAWALILAPASAQPAFVPDFRVHRDDYTVLMAVDSAHSPDLRPFQSGGHGKFYVCDWTRPDQSASWQVTVPADDDYAVNVLLHRRKGGAVQMEVAAAGRRVTGTLPVSASRWQRQSLRGTLHLPKGRVSVGLRLQSEDAQQGFSVEVLSVELVRPSVRDRLHQSAQRMRADTRELRRARYGFMFHWTSSTCPRAGEPKPYAEAVNAFNVEAFADQVKEGGAGFVVLTTSHAFQYFPAPIQALERILPGRTSRRDLVGEIADALGRRGIRLWLYYHLGASSDPAWMKASGFFETNTARLFDNWCSIVGEVGRRYGAKLAGWWFDDGSVSYYYRSAPWERLARAARAGDRRRLIGFNPWELPPPTEFQDYLCGEGFDDPSVDGALPVGGDGRFPSGPYRGLQACATLITEGDWGHWQKDAAIGEPRWTAPEMASYLAKFAAHRNVPIFNLEIYQDGTCSPRTIAMFKQAASSLAPSPVRPKADPPADCQIVWETPSKDSLDSMPLPGRLGAGANVWVQDGSIWIYLAHNGAYDEQGRLLKLGCMRVTPAGMSLGSAGFRQELDPATGTITIRQGDYRASLWFAGETLMLESESVAPRALDVAFGTWRDRPRDGVRIDMMGAKGSFTPEHILADTDGFAWFHRNADTLVDVVGMAKGQGIAAAAVHDATSRRVSGGAIAVDGGLTQPTGSTARWQYWDGETWTGRTASRSAHVIAVRLGAKLDADPRQWRAEAKLALTPDARRASRAAESRRWKEFWSRSHVVINPTAASDDPGRLVGRNYQLFRYMLACNRDGELPLLFNGGIFTTDNVPGRITGNNNDELPIAEGEPITPDFRRWMGCHFMSQNQRWLGWPTLANGDPDLLAPSLAFYRDRSGTAAARARTNGAEGVVYPEPLDIWGLCCVAPRPDGLCGADHLTYHFSMMLEHAWMALQAHDTLGISIAHDLRWIAGTVLFYDSFYRAQARTRTGKELGEDGKLVIYPSNGLELAGGATDPLEVVAGLRRVTAGLLALPELKPASRARLQRVWASLPDLPTGQRQRRAALLPAKTWEREYNKWEPIEMYAAWPYRLVGITRPDTLQLARDTWETIPADRARLCKQDYSWMANLVNMAALAWPERAKERAIYKMANTSAPQARFPAFFGPGHDWLPDHNWGGAGMAGVQEMLLAPEPGPHGKLHLFAGWPTEWDVDFRLHAPGQTIVEGVLRGGKLRSLKVTPRSRAANVVHWLGKTPPYEAPPPPPRPLSQGKPATASSTFVEQGYDPARAFDGDLATRWASDFAARDGWLAVDLGEELEIGRIRLSEIEWQETREFAIEVKQGDTWKEVARGTTIGSDKEIALSPIRARFVRLRVLKAVRPININ